MESKEEFLLDLLNSLIDDRIDIYGYRETLDYLIDYGVSEDILTEELQFDADDVKEAVRENKESEEEKE